jgi:hypothetical protein
MGVYFRVFCDRHKEWMHLGKFAPHYLWINDLMNEPVGDVVLGLYKDAGMNVKEMKKQIEDERKRLESWYTKDEVKRVKENPAVCLKLLLFMGKHNGCKLVVHNDSEDDDSYRSKAKKYKELFKDLDKPLLKHF